MPPHPILFIVALDTLVRHLQEMHLHRGIQFCYGPLLVSLYVDDILLFIRGPAANLSLLIQEITRYSGLSGLHINWHKSELFPLMEATPPTVFGISSEVVHPHH